MERFLKSNYKTGEKIGENTYSITYKGKALLKDEDIIIKIYKRATLTSPLIKVMKNKVRQLCQLSHPGVAKLFDGDYGWQGFYYVREYVIGESLKTLLEKHAVLEEDDALKIGLKICESLSAVHNFGLVHGALNPNNVFITPDGTVKLTDFVVEGEIKESIPQKIEFMQSAIEYLSPEEIQGEKASPASDIYSLGLLLYKMMTGRMPFKENGSRLGTALKILKSSITPPSFYNPKISKGAEELILKALSLDPMMRFRNVNYFKDSLVSKSVVMPIFSFNIPQIEYENSGKGPSTQKIIKQGKAIMEKIEKESNYQGGNWMVRLLILLTLGGILYAIISAILKI